MGEPAHEIGDSRRHGGDGRGWPRRGSDRRTAHTKTRCGTPVTRPRGVRKTPVEMIRHGVPNVPGTHGGLGSSSVSSGTDSIFSKRIR